MKVEHMFGGRRGWGGDAYSWSMVLLLRPQYMYCRGPGPGKNVWRVKNIVLLMRRGRSQMWSLGWSLHKAGVQVPDLALIELTPYNRGMKDAKLIAKAEVPHSNLTPFTVSLGLCRVIVKYYTNLPVNPNQICIKSFCKPHV